MIFLNRWDIEERETRHRHSPNLVLRAATRLLLNLMDWANANSDGWHSWPAPSRASQQLQQLLQPPYPEITAEQFKKAMVPIKALCTKRKIPLVFPTPDGNWSDPPATEKGPMHIFEGQNGTRFAYNSDLSAVQVLRHPSQIDPKPTSPVECRVTIDGADLLGFVANYVRSTRIAELEQATSSRSILGLPEKS